jgi:hypothetical protein
MNELLENTFIFFPQDAVGENTLCSCPCYGSNTRVIQTRFRENMTDLLPVIRIRFILNRGKLTEAGFESQCVSTQVNIICEN